MEESQIHPPSVLVAFFSSGVRLVQQNTLSNKYLLSTYCVSNTVHGPGDLSVNNRQESALMGNRQ